MTTKSYQRSNGFKINLTIRSYRLNLLKFILQVGMFTFALVEMWSLDIRTIKGDWQTYVFMIESFVLTSALLCINMFWISAIVVLF